MKFKNTQPLEEATPVVPETAATISPDERRPPATHGDDPSPEPPPAPPAPQAGDNETYPAAPAGSAGHP